MQRNHKAGPKNVHLKAGHSASELNYSRPPVVISSSSFKRYDLEERETSNKIISLSAIAGLGRFLPVGLKFSPRRKIQ